MSATQDEAVASASAPGAVPPDNSVTVANDGAVTAENVDAGNADSDAQVNTGGMRYVLIRKYNGGKKSEVCPLPSIPSAKSIRYLPANEVRYTFEYIPIREHSPSRAWALSFRGMTGVSIFGMNSLKRFDRFVHLYQVDAVTNGAMYLNSHKYRELRERTWLELWDLEDGMGWRVEVKGWDWDRGSQTRVKNAEWALSLQGYSFVEGLKAQGGSGDYRPGRASKETLSAISKDIQGAASAEEAARALAHSERMADIVAMREDLYLYSGWTSDTMENISQGISRFSTTVQSYTQSAQRLMAQTTAVGGLARSLQESVRSIQDLSRTADAVAVSWITLADELVNLPIQVIGLLRDAVQVVRRNLVNVAKLLGDTWKAYGQVKDVEGPMGSLWNALKFFGEMGSTLEVALGISGAKAGPLSVKLPPSGTATNGTNFRAADDPYSGGAIPYKMNPGDTLETLAITLYGDPELWQLIAKFNGMSSAFSGSDGKPIAAGSIVLLPQTTGIGINVPQAQKAKDIYGTDWLIDPVTGDRVINNQSYVSYDGTTYKTNNVQGSDCVTISGVPNLLQAVSNRIKTVNGSVPVVQTYGALTTPPGAPFMPGQLATAMVDVQTQLRRDPRILKITKMDPRKDADKLSLSLQIVPVTGGTIGVITPLGN